MLLWVGAQGVPIGRGISQINFEGGDKAQRDVLRDARREALIEAKSLSEEEISDLGKFGLLSWAPTSQKEVRFKIQIVHTGRNFGFPHCYPHYSH